MENNPSNLTEFDLLEKAAFEKEKFEGL